MIWKPFNICESPPLPWIHLIQAFFLPLRENTAINYPPLPFSHSFLYLTEIFQLCQFFHVYFKWCLIQCEKKKIKDRNYSLPVQTKQEMKDRSYETKSHLARWKTSTRHYLLLPSSGPHWKPRSLNQHTNLYQIKRIYPLGTSSAEKKRAVRDLFPDATHLTEEKPADCAQCITVLEYMTIMPFLFFTWADHLVSHSQRKCH